jgi:putative phosphoribosyl transferase
MSVFGKQNIFLDRSEAGKLLAEKLLSYKDNDPVAVAIPRGGVPIAYEVANLLHAPLEVLITRKIGSPRNPEFGIGAVAEGGVTYLDKRTILRLLIPKEVLDKIIEREEEEIMRRIILYRNKRPLMQLKNRTVILIDDGLATGVTAQAAIKAIKRQKPKQIIFAAPVCAYETTLTVNKIIDNTVCIDLPYNLQAIGSYYKNFNQINDEDVVRLLKKVRA